MRLCAQPAALGAAGGSQPQQVEQEGSPRGSGPPTSSRCGAGAGNPLGLSTASQWEVAAGSSGLSQVAASHLSKVLTCPSAPITLSHAVTLVLPCVHPWLSAAVVLSSIGWGGHWVSHRGAGGSAGASSALWVTLGDEHSCFYPHSVCPHGAGAQTLLRWASPHCPPSSFPFWAGTLQHCQHRTKSTL